jgi:hypothetical protein
MSPVRVSLVNSGNGSSVYRSGRFTVYAILFQHAIDHVFLILSNWPVRMFSIENPLRFGEFAKLASFGFFYWTDMRLSRFDVGKDAS